VRIVPDLRFASSGMTKERSSLRFVGDDKAAALKQGT